MRASARSALAVVLLVALNACMTSRGRTVDPLPPPPSTVAPPSTTIAPDFSEVALARVRGATTTTTIALGPGEATLKGTVTAPDGPVGSALVRVERLVGGAVAAVEVATQADGTWSSPAIKGGAFRVRAWRAPDLALVQPAFIFIGAKETFPLDLKLERYAGPFATAAVAPNPPVVGAPVNLAVQLSQRSVDDRGFVTGVPLVGTPVQLASSTGGWAVASANPALTDANGRARWVVRCGAVGAHPLSVSLGGAVAPLPLVLPSCVESVSPASTTPGSTPTSSSPPITVLPRPSSSTSSTTTTTTTTTKPPTTTTTTRVR